MPDLPKALLGFALLPLVAACAAHRPAERAAHQRPAAPDHADPAERTPAERARRVHRAQGDERPRAVLRDRIAGEPAGTDFRPAPAGCSGRGCAQAAIRRRAMRARRVSLPVVARRGADRDLCRRPPRERCAGCGPGCLRQSAAALVPAEIERGFSPILHGQRSARWHCRNRHACLRWLATPFRLPVLEQPGRLLFHRDAALPAAKAVNDGKRDHSSDDFGGRVHLAPRP